MVTFRRGAVLASAVAVLIAGGATPTAAASGLSDWWSSNSASVHGLESAFEDAAISADAENVEGFQNACTRLQSATSAVSAALPTPDPALTAALQDAVGQYQQASQYCDAVGPAMDPFELSQSQSIMLAGIAQMDKAFSILAQAQKPAS